MGGEERPVPLRGLHFGAKATGCSDFREETVNTKKLQNSKFDSNTRLRNSRDGPSAFSF